MKMKVKFNSESLYDVYENIDDLSDLDDEFDKARQPNIQEQNIEFREELQTYCIQKGVNLKLKSNEKERIRAKYKKGCP
ncbi:hypothetical protein KY289_008459 [Solanum tuberosum]|nr:hypothetical protein KY289_008459 [Solanum tuberosum]